MMISSFVEAEIIWLFLARMSLCTSLNLFLYCLKVNPRGRISILIFQFIFSSRILIIRAAQ